MYSARRGTSRSSSFSADEHRQRLAEHRGDVLERVAVADGVVPVAVLADLLDAAVQVAQHRVEVHDALAVDLEDDAQDAVGGGVLRAQVDEHLAVAERVELGLALRARRVAAGWRRRWWPASGRGCPGRRASGCGSARSVMAGPRRPRRRRSRRRGGRRRGRPRRAQALAVRARGPRPRRGSCAGPAAARTSAGRQRQLHVADALAGRARGVVGEDEVLAQREGQVVGRHVDAAQVAVALEDDAEHVVGLALGPLGAVPQEGDRRARAGRRARGRRR